MHQHSNNDHVHGAQTPPSSSLLFNPVSFPCRCAKTPIVEKGCHPDSGKDGYFVVRCCRCAHQSLYAKERYKAILDWNMKPLSQDSGALICPGLQLEGLNAVDALEVVKDEFSRLKMVISDHDRPHMEAAQWHRLKARTSWCQMLVTVLKRRLKSFNAPPQNSRAT